jgi:murein DD-endopeptidase MepM/ murein hydrolase activator NlpD
MGRIGILVAWLCVSCWLLATAAVPAQAANVYKYKDAKGRWVISDKPPPRGAATAEVEQKRLVFTEKSHTVAVVNRGSQQRPALYAVNQTAGPAEVWVEFTRQENLKFSEAGPHHWLLPPMSERFALRLAAADENRSWAYEWTYFYVPGEPGDPGKIGLMELEPPFRGGPFPISQAFMGEASHKQHPESHYAVDIVMPGGTPITAARPGLVTEVERDFSRSGWSLEYADEANYVRVLHDNGTMAVYAHLAPDAIEVAVGQQVKAGQLLGYSGTTGYSTGPHLHFVLQFNRGKQLISLPFRFRGQSAEPQTGQRLQGKR